MNCDTSVVFNVNQSSQSQGMKTAIQDAIKNFLERVQIPFPVPQEDKIFERACWKEATTRGYPVEDLRPFLDAGIKLSAYSYAHLPDFGTRIYIALYTGLLMYLDDLCQTNVENVRNFCERFMRNEPQPEKILDDIASLLRETSNYWGTFVSSMILTATFNFISALLLDIETKDMEIHESAFGYPSFSRRISGLSEAYALFVFPADLPLQSFIQALPEVILFANQANDVLSFYKEECKEESLNHVSLLASVHQMRKIDALDMVIADTDSAHSRALSILSSSERAHAAYKAYSHGYVAFHAASRRYRLDELELLSVVA